MGNLTGYIITGVVSLIVGLLLQYLKPMAKVVWWQAHDFLFEIPQGSFNPGATGNPLILHTQTIMVKNTGRKEASMIEIIHKKPPDFFKLKPALDYEEGKTPAGEHVVRIRSLGSQEVFAIEFLSHLNFPELLLIRSSSGHAKEIPIQYIQLFPQWVNRLIQALFFSGLGVWVYFLIRVGHFLLQATGIIQ